MPRSGPAGTVEWKLLRANKQPQDEAQHHGIAYWDVSYTILAASLLNPLTSDPLLVPSGACSGTAGRGPAQSPFPGKGGILRASTIRVT